jgi:hypothetical protein
VIGWASLCEVHARHHIGQYDLCELAARKATEIFEQTGDLWWQAEIQAGLALVPLHCGRPVEAEKLLLTAIASSAKVGHDSARSLSLMYLAAARIHNGDLEKAERTVSEAMDAGASSQVGWIFLAETFLASMALLVMVRAAWRHHS